MAIWLKDPSRNQFDAKTGTAFISKIFDWYEKDFVEWGSGVDNVLKKHGAGVFPAHAKIKYLDYDWGLNEAR
jgi:hypothetical protein